MKPSKEVLIGLIENNLLFEHHSTDIQQIVDDLPEDNDEALGRFCDRFELGNWFYEAMQMNEIDISTELIDIGTRRQAEESESARDREDIRRDIERSQGWPS